jgi:hypothetical protein
MTADPLVILLAGGRELPEPGIVPGTLADIALNIAEGPVVIRHGACPGEHSADQAASDWITEYGIRYRVTEDPMPADWDHCDSQCPPGHRRRKRPGDVAHPGVLADYCPHAGPRRNAQMVAKLPRPAWMVAFPDPTGPSYGTRNCIRLAEQAGLTVHPIWA